MSQHVLDIKEAVRLASVNNFLCLLWNLQRKGVHIFKNKRKSSNFCYISYISKFYMQLANFSFCNGCMGWTLTADLFLSKMETTILVPFKVDILQIFMMFEFGATGRCVISKEIASEEITLFNFFFHCEREIQTS